jgi:hypothetical protein
MKPFLSFSVFLSVTSISNQPSTITQLAGAAQVFYNHQIVFEAQNKPIS